MPKTASRWHRPTYSQSFVGFRLARLVHFSLSLSLSSNAMSPADLSRRSSRRPLLRYGPATPLRGRPAVSPNVRNRSRSFVGSMLWGPCWSPPSRGYMPWRGRAPAASAAQSVWQEVRRDRPPTATRWLDGGKRGDGA